MSNKKITAFNINTNPTFGDVFPIVNNGETKQMSLSGLSEYLGVNLSGVTYNDISGVLTFDTNKDTQIILTGFTVNIKHYINNQNKIIKSDETIVISGDYVIENTNLTLENESSITIGDLTFYKYGQIFIGGNLLIKDSNIINNGLINVAGAVILNGNSTITGIGNLI